MCAISSSSPRPSMGDSRPTAVSAMAGPLSASGTATAGQYENTGCVAGTSPTGAAVNACNPDHYYGETPKIAIVKKTNGSDNDTGTGPIVAVGSTVTTPSVIRSPTRDSARSFPPLRPPA